MEPNMVKAYGQFDLVYSEDDAGFYWECGDYVSRTFKTEQAAMKYYNGGELKQSYVKWCRKMGYVKQ